MPYASREKRLEYSKKYNEETRKWAKENGICIVCHKEKADDGYATCLQCRMASRERSKNRPKLTGDKLTAQRSRLSKRRATLIAQGICIQCGKRKTNGYQICDVCRAKISKKRRQKYGKNKDVPILMYGESGFCSRCGKPTYANSKLCKFHYDVAIQNLGKIKNRGTQEYRNANKLFFERRTSYESDKSGS